jgi:hypothetical protein
MKKLHIILIIICVILFSLIYLSISGIQTVSTDKKIYYSGEEVKIHWSDFSLEWCSCSNKVITVFKRETTDWESVQYQLYGFGNSVCVDGKLVGLPYPCDVISCSFPILNSKSGDFSWNSKIYEKKGSVNSCLNPFNNEVRNRTMQSYELKNVPSGKYKIKFGTAEKIIEII